MTTKKEKPIELSESDAPVEQLVPVPFEHNAVAYTDLAVTVFVFDPILNADKELVVRMSVTARAETPRAAIELLASAIDGETVRPFHDVRQTTPAAPGPAAAAPAKPAPAPAPGQAPNRPAAAPAASSPAGSALTSGVVHATRLQVSGRPDGKIQLQFFEDNHQFADLTGVWTVEQAVRYMESTGDRWDSETLAETGEYQVDYAVAWRNSEKLNRNGRPYRNIYSIVPWAS